MTQALETASLLRIGSFGLSVAAFVMACAAAPPAPSRSASDPSNPNAAEGALSTSGASEAPAPTSRSAVYSCPMHPSIASREPGQRCSICGMALVPHGSGP